MKKKAVIAGAVAGILLFSGVAVFAVKNINDKKVTVVPVQELTGFGGEMDFNNISGMITSDVSQEIRLATGQVVDEIFVKEGDLVKVGDKLISYDMTLANLELEMKKLDKEGTVLKIDKAKRDLKKLRTIKPFTQGPETGGTIFPEDPYFPEEPYFPEDPEVPQEPGENVPDKVTAEERLDENSQPYMGSGTAEDPFHFLVSQKGTIQGGFLNRMAEEGGFFLIEVREGDHSYGELMKVWGEKISQQGYHVDENEVYEVNLKLQAQERKEIPAFEQLTAEQIEKEEWIAGDGTEERPYIFLIKKEGYVKGSFFNKMKELGKYFRLEVRKEDKNDGILIQTWVQDGKLLEKVSDEEEFTVSVERKVRTTPQPEEKPTVEPTQRPTMEPTKEPAAEPTETPTMEPTTEPTIEPTGTPTMEPTAEPTIEPTGTPTMEPTKEPTVKPEGRITTEPAMELTDKPMAYKKEKNGKPVMVHTSQRSVGEFLEPPSEYMTAEELKKEIQKKEEEIRDLQLDLKSIELEVNKMERRLKDQTITSTLNGVVKTVGDPKNPAMDGSPLIFVAGSEGLYVTGQVNEMQLEQMKKGTVLDGFSYESGIGFTAEVTEISPYPAGEQGGYGGANSSMYPFTAYIAETEGLQNYSWADLSIVKQDEEISHAIVIEKAFVRSENGQYYVMVEGKNGKLKKQPVGVARVVNGYAYEISSGLALEDKIAFPYGKHVVEGAKTEEGTMQDIYM